MGAEWQSNACCIGAAVIDGNGGDLGLTSKSGKRKWGNSYAALEAAGIELKARRAKPIVER